MQSHANKTQGNLSQAVANELNQKQGTDEVMQFVDNRHEAVAQRKLQEMANDSNQVEQLRTVQAMADNYAARHVPMQKKENKTGLPDNLKSGIENLSGYSMDDVKVHYNSNKPLQLYAHAYAQGTDIHVAAGQENHLPHEAWHVVQQKQGKVKATIQLKANIQINDNSDLEKEADEMGAKAIQFANAPLQSINQKIFRSKIIQCAFDKNKFNIVGENHKKYTSEVRELEKREVEQMLGEGTYHMENSFSGGAYEDADQGLVDFTRKADPPYYSVHDGLRLMRQELTNLFKDISTDFPFVNGVQRMMEDTQQLSKGNTRDKHLLPLMREMHEKLIAICGGGNPNKDSIREAIQLVNGINIILENDYTNERQIFERMAEIHPSLPTLSKRSKTMFDHALAYAKKGNKGVLKVGQNHLDDMKNVQDTPELAFCDSSDLLKERARAHNSATSTSTDHEEYQSPREQQNDTNHQRDFDAEDDFF